MASNDHWHHYTFSNVAEVRRGLSWATKQERREPVEGTVPVLRIPNIQDRLVLDDLLYLVDVDTKARQECSATKGWTLMVSSNGNPDRVGNCVYVGRDTEFVFASFLMAVGTRDESLLDSEYLFRLLRSDEIQRAISRNVQGSTGLSNINLPLLLKQELSLPSVAVQRRICSVLKAVDGAIEATRAVIEQTRRLKTALLQDLLTNGLPGGHKKFKNVRGLGRIPAGWDVVRLDEIATVERGKFTHRPRNDPRFYGGEIPFVQTGDIVASGDYLREHSQTLNEHGLSVSRMFPKGTILFAIAASVGATTIASYDVAFPDSIVGITPNPGVQPLFLLRVLQAAKNRTIRTATESAQANISLELLRPLPFALPSEDEQEAIARALRTVEERLEQTRAQLYQLIRVKTALSQGLLTGRIPVKVEGIY